VRQLRWGLAFQGDAKWKCHWALSALTSLAVQQLAGAGTGPLAASSWLPPVEDGLWVALGLSSDQSKPEFLNFYFR
jgi:hypothetical protein